MIEGKNIKNTNSRWNGIKKIEKLTSHMILGLDGQSPSCHTFMPWKLTPCE